MLTAGSPNIGVWATTNVPGAQIDRMGRPAIATVFIPNNPIPPDRVSDGKPSAKSAFNHTRPVDDQAMWRGEVVDTLTTLFSLNDATDPNPGDDAGQIQGLADFLLPARGLPVPRKAELASWRSLEGAASSRPFSTGGCWCLRDLRLPRPAPPAR